MIDSHTLEANYLDVMWAAQGQPEPARMRILKWLAQVVIPRGQEWNYAAVRAEQPPITLSRRCFVCGDTGQHQHHVIQLQHGGSNCERNIVRLCRGCHAEIHPWLPKPIVRGWTCVSEMATGVLETWAHKVDSPR